MVSNITQVRPTPLACAECRTKHLKCDGATPRCGRCDAEGLHCVYKPSRRGYGRKNAIRRDPDAIRGQNTPENYASIPNSGIPASSRLTPDTGGPSPTHDGATTYEGSQRAVTPVQLRTPQSSLHSRSSTLAINWQTIDRDLLMKSYYAHFHPTHPLLLPRTFFARRRYPEYLQWTVYFIGQQYISYSGSQDIASVLAPMLAPGRDEMTVCRVQALVLYAIVLHSMNQPQEALECVRRATEISNSLGLARANSASSNSNPGSVEEESIRRTWWELYIVEAYLAALHRRLSRFSNGQEPYPSLPSFEASYNAGTCDVNPPSLGLFESRAFAREHERIRFSRYCYRIEAARILHRVVDLFASGEEQPDAVQAVDIAIASWNYHLPEANEDDLDDSEEVDPLLFQAQFLVHSASILLHFSRSDLPPTVPTAAEIACVRSHAQRIPGSMHHSTKAIKASKEIVNLAASLSSTNTCSPLFICALILACIVQLASSTVHPVARRDLHLSHHRDRIVLLLGVLTDMGRRWTVARNALQPLRIVADTIFGTPHKDTTMTPSPANTYGSGVSANEVFAGVPWFDLFSVDDLMADFMSSAPEPAFGIQSSAI